MYFIYYFFGWGGFIFSKPVIMYFFEKVVSYITFVCLKPVNYYDSEDLLYCSWEWQYAWSFPQVPHTCPALPPLAWHRARGLPPQTAGFGETPGRPVAGGTDSGQRIQAPSFLWQDHWNVIFKFYMIFPILFQPGISRVYKIAIHLSLLECT